MGCLPSLRPEPHFGWLVHAINAVDSEEQRRIALFSICDGETRIGAGDNDVAITDQLDAKGHDTASEPLHYAFVDGLSVPDSRQDRFPTTSRRVDLYVIRHNHKMGERRKPL
jgi:hypothetical protein